ncbi:hypothetical protein Pfo_010915 [Paulownia fortunei]|nr:hypothetical protein Pfo_010915 [Paulownia fortunei]
MDMDEKHKEIVQMTQETKAALEKIRQNLRKIERFRPAREFTGTFKRTGPKERQVEFKKDQKLEEDLFGLYKFLADMKTCKKIIDRVGSGDILKASN